MPSKAHESHCIRQAAVTVARRVAEEQGTEIGRGVGYAVRFEERSSPATRIKYLTGERTRCLEGPFSAGFVSVDGEQCCGCTAADMASGRRPQCFTEV